MDDREKKRGRQKKEGKNLNSFFDEIKRRWGLAQMRDKAQRWKGLKSAKSPENENVLDKKKIDGLIISWKINQIKLIRENLIKLPWFCVSPFHNNRANLEGLKEILNGGVFFQYNRST